MLNDEDFINPTHILGRESSSARKRSSGCLVPTGKNNQTYFQVGGLARYPKGSFRKTRRFTETGQNTQGIPLYELEQEDFTPVSITTTNPGMRRTNRRSSLHAPKTTWPGYEHQQEPLSMENAFNDSYGALPHLNSFKDFDALYMDNAYPNTDFGGESKHDIRFYQEDGFQPLKSDIRYKFDFMNYKQQPQEEVKLESHSNLQHHSSSDASVCSKTDSLVKKGAWTPEEDDLLMKFGGMANSKNWTEIAEKIPGRSAKQCRERWCFNLDPTINKELWTPEEDGLLIRKQIEVGNKWAQIAQLLPGRTENAVKTRFKSIVRARKREWKPSEDQLLLDLHRSLGANWENIASRMDSHRTKHAVKMRFKELQAGLTLLKLPEYGSARQTVRESYYPQATIEEISAHYRKLANGSSANSTSSYVGSVSFARPQPAPALKFEEHNNFDRTFDDLFTAMYAEDEPVLLA